jgi:hypothetical protein
MSEQRNLSSACQPIDGLSTYETFSPQQDLRPGNRPLTEVTDRDGDDCVRLAGHSRCSVHSRIFSTAC